MEVLHLKHPESRPPKASSLEAYGGKPPAMVMVDITNVTVANITGRISGEAGPGGMDLVSLQHWMLRFGAESMGHRQIVGEFRDCMANGRPPWTAYR